MEALSPVLWPDAEPTRLARDVAEVQAFVPDLVYTAPRLDADGVPEHHGAWRGVLPTWPFDRPEPLGLSGLVPTGLNFVMLYQAAHPMVPPRIYPVDPKPEISEHTQHRWHVAPGGSLCLLQRVGMWAPEASITDLLLKAAGWRIEYALLKAGAIESMTEHGIVTDAALDGLITDTAERIAHATSSPAEAAQTSTGGLDADD